MTCKINVYFLEVKVSSGKKKMTNKLEVLPPHPSVSCSCVTVLHPDG